jgi:peptide-methionine (S)-S-oxide reductase
MKMAWIGGAAVAVLAAGALTLAFGPGRGPGVEPSTGEPAKAAAAEGEKEKEKGKTMKTATFGAGCFWCVEAVYQELKGVKKVVSGYAGGTVKNPTYQQVCTGTTGHAEVAQLTYDPEVVTYPELLEVFWKTHDPTTLNRQGGDSGTQYRSVIFYHDDEQKKLAEEYKAKLDASGAFNSPIVTQIAKLPEFYPAENYHQNYYRSNPNQGYCQFVIVPKLEKFRKVFHDKLQK